MKLAISNIAWEKEEAQEAANKLHEFELSQVEVAPTKAWDKPLEATDKDIAAYRQWWAERGLTVVALQALNFGRPDFAMFGDVAKRTEMLEYLKRITVLGTKLGASVMIFGSPKNRLVGDMPHDQSMEIAIKFFDELGTVAADHGAAFCIEPNPTDYGCDFVTDSHAGIELVKAVGNPGFGLHLDAAGLTLAGDDPAKVIPEALPFMRHFHVSAPFLEEVGPGKVDHALIAQTLSGVGYNKTISIEMKAGEAGTNLPRIQRTLTYVDDIYGAGLEK